jgi:4-hydroxybenzoate polyprenyltransferase
MKSSIQSYISLMRLDKPIGTFLVLWPVLWALWLANDGMPSIRLLFIFIAGTIIMRSAGCVINDICDRNLDKFVARTHMRPLAQEKLPISHAWILFFILMALALLLVLQLNLFTILLAVATAFLVMLYPLSKRITQVPQVVLGITFNAGVLLAYSATLEKIPLEAWILFIVCVIWTIAYDTLYAMVDKPDDLKLGIKSTAILFGRYDLIITIVLYVLFFTGMLFIGFIENLGTIYIFSLIAAISYISYYLFNARYNTPSACFKAFIANNTVGLLLFSGIFLAYFVI